MIALLLGFIFCGIGIQFTLLSGYYLIQTPQWSVYGFLAIASSVALFYLGLRLVRVKKQVLLIAFTKLYEQQKDFVPKDIDIKAIFIGVGIDLGGTLIYWNFMILFLQLWLPLTAMGEGPDIDLTSIANQNIFIISGLPSGLAFTALGGNFTTRFARSKNLVSAALVGCLGIIVGFLSPSAMPRWAYNLAILLAVPASITGGYLHIRKWKFW